jgi:cytochrome c556
MIRTVRRTAIAAVAIAAFTVPLLAAPADTVRVRTAGFKEIGGAFKAINDSLRGDANVAVIRQATQKINANARAQYRWFPRGTGPQPGLKTGAKPEIWSQAPQFRAAQDAFAAQAAALNRAAAGGNVDAIRTEARKLGGTCKGCHDNFRSQS